MQKSVDVFLGYAMEDRELSLEVKKRLAWLEREGFIRTWHEYTISAGMERKHEILRYLGMAQIILLFISADFIASNFCYDVELTQAMERHERGEVRVIPIILRSVYWQETPLGKLQALPRDHKPVKSCRDRDKVLTEIEEDIRIIIKSIVSEKYIKESRTYFEQKHYVQAIEACEYALRCMPTSPTAYRLRGLALLELRRYDEAVQDYDHAIRLGLGIASVYKERGDALYYLHQYNSALISYKEAISLNTDFAAAYKGASETLRKIAQEYMYEADIYAERARKLLQLEEINTQEDFQ